jgi:2-polyprenyl-6-methoxyphenol hydroxylase-like FAD-dependent oxidoreductase
MRVVVVGAGPVGIMTAIGLARQRHAVTVVDRDPGPAPDGTWVRKGVMQFRQPHGFRPTVHRALSDVLPDLWDTLVDTGCVAVAVPGAPAGTISLCARRATFERGMRRALAAEPGVTLRFGHADGIVADSSTMVGVRVDSAVVEADCVVVATGRAGYLGREFRAQPHTVPCGVSYVSRVYRGRPGTDPIASPGPIGAMADGYLTIVFPHDDHTLSTLIVRPTADTALAGLRDTTVFDRVAAQIPNLAPWVDPARYEPITDPMPGAGLTNTYHSVLDEAGRCALPGLLFVGDAVLTTNPQAGRGISTGFAQARTLLRLLARDTDLASVAAEFDAWATANQRPWFDDHVYWDATLLRRWAGDGLDLDARIPTDVVSAAAEVDPTIMPAAMAYNSMTALPGVLDPFRQRARAVLRTGWRPPIAAGPSRADLARLVRDHEPVAA